ncbi:MAG TPA: hypothetical protein DGT23_01435 [Micromonosporaceae bacterium]|nr:hypothetical protein [Micromonosporaceae bacterium]
MSNETPSAPVTQAPPDPAEQPWAARFGLVRPRHGRYVAGVCAAIGRATNTDALLWRVLIGVLSIFGVGIVLYLAGWLLMPAEGDTASPIEALFGRGYSSTSTALTLGLAIVAVILLGALTNSFVVAVIAAVGLIVAALAANPKNRQPIPARMEPSPPPGDPTATAPTATVPVTPPGYQPPFAPHGPYVSAPAPVPPPPYKAAKPKREPSRLGRLIFGVILIALGALGIADLSSSSVPAAVYIATALAVTGAGLIVGAWAGRARFFILIGIVLSLMLPIAADEENRERSARAGTVAWVPMSYEELAEGYEHRFGEATLDLSNVDFSNREAEVFVAISFGDLKIIVPPNVDVTVNSDVNLGDASVFGYESSGAGVEHVERNDGADGPGGGTLRLRLDVKFGHAEVTR